MDVGQRSDLGPSWYEASDDSRACVEQEIEALDARLAFDAALGALERHRGERDYKLWRAVSQGGGRLDEWWGRIRSAPTTAAKLRVLSRAVRVNVEHMALELGRRPSPVEIAIEFAARPVRGVRELWRRVARRHP
jgi:hypothetical protein